MTDYLILQENEVTADEYPRLMADYLILQENGVTADEFPRLMTDYLILQENGVTVDEFPRLMTDYLILQENGVTADEFPRLMALLGHTGLPKTFAGQLEIVNMVNIGFVIFDQKKKFPKMVYFLQSIIIFWQKLQENLYFYFY